MKRDVVTALQFGDGVLLRNKNTFITALLLCFETFSFLYLQNPEQDVVFEEGQQRQNIIRKARRQERFFLTHLDPNP